MAPKHVLVLDLMATSKNWALTDEGLERIQSAAPDDWEVRAVRAPTSSDGDGARGPSAESLRAIADAEVYFGFGISPPLFREARRLRWVHSAAAGVGAALFPEMKASDVALTNSAGVHAVPIAEYVVGGLLYLLRGFDIAVEQQRAARWDKAPFVALDSPLRELGDCRALILGTGGLGGETAKRLTALGATCVGLRRRPERGAPPGFARVAALDAIDAELPAADIVVLAAPATPATIGVLTAERLTRLPRGAIVVNVARGTLLDEDALVERIRGGHLRGAVLDVFRDEPLAPDSPLWQLRSVLVTPHVSPVSPRGYWRRELALFLDNWARYREGRELVNLVDKEQGY